MTMNTTPTGNSHRSLWIGAGIVALIIVVIVIAMLASGGGGGGGGGY